jgi:signal transduction histidine kinase
MSKKILFTDLFLLAGVLGLIAPGSAQQSPPHSERAKQIVALVNKAAQLIDSKGKAVFPELGKPDSDWRQGDTYVFVDDMKGVPIFSGGFPILNGKDVSTFRDANGKPFFQKFIKTVQAKGSGWVDYMWPKPGQRQPSQKWSYVKAVTIDGTPGLVGAGFYPQ